MSNKKKIDFIFLKDGFYDFGSVLNKKKCLELKRFINSKRPCNKNIFYKSKKEFLRKRFLFTEIECLLFFFYCKNYLKDHDL